MRDHMGATWCHASASAEDAVFQRFGRVAMITIITFVLLSGLAAGQENASIVGRITDDSGGVLPGVTVTATSPALQLAEISVVTDAQGEYRLSELPIGTYDVEYSLPGFQSIRREGLRLTVGLCTENGCGLDRRIGD